MQADVPIVGDLQAYIAREKLEKSSILLLSVEIECSAGGVLCVYATIRMHWC
jgi:hypothetical protein